MDTDTATPVYANGRWTYDLDAAGAVDAVQGALFDASDSPALFDLIGE